MTPAEIDARIAGLRKFLAAHVPLTVYADVCIRVEAEIKALTSREGGQGRYSDVVSDGGMDPRNRDQRPLPTLADLTMLVDDLAAKARSSGIVSGRTCSSHERISAAAHDAEDARVALLAAIGMLTGGEG